MTRASRPDGENHLDWQDVTRERTDDALPGFPSRHRAAVRAHLEDVVSLSEPSRRRAGTGRRWPFGPALFAYAVVPATLVVLVVAVAMLHRVGHTPGVAQVSGPQAAPTAAAGHPSSSTSPATSPTRTPSATTSPSRTTTPSHPVTGTATTTPGRSATASDHPAPPATGSTGSRQTSSTTAATQGAFWLYHDGAFGWGGDWSYSATADYGSAAAGDQQITVRLTGQWGGWQPYAPGQSFATTGYSRITLALKPTQAGQRWYLETTKSTDTAASASVNLLSYGPTPVVGQWAVYTVPLADLGVSGTTLKSVTVQDQTGATSNTWYVKDVAFLR